MNGILRGLVAVAFAAAILYAMQRTTPGYGEITSPIPVVGEPGKRVDTTAFAIGIAKVHLARTVTTKGTGRTSTYTTTGIWVLVEGAAEARTESLTLTSADWLGPNGVRYALSQRFSSLPGSLPGQRLEPGLPKPVLMAFEIPESQVSGGILLVSRSAFKPLAEEARIQMTGVRPDDIHRALTLGRSGGEPPWTLDVE